MGRSEAAIFTNMCMIEDDEGHVLVQDRAGKNWPGITFPGGHVEPGESFVTSVVREVYEETGLIVKNPRLCGIKQFQTVNKERYVVLLFKANQHSGEVRSSEEGEVFWVEKAQLHTYQLANNFEDMLAVFENDQIAECYYEQQDEQFTLKLL
ncbi:8-oxo-dGTP diphosphatase [Ornithinibacillus gellani]|uniref:8-oxo-dGTP diphosphatase n=1 Tax=Ornithinibacillus gellani TaxID=2293253 RepID=UPI000F47DD28|nr:8-oxo-dGTP diphosphatase [Ornithinibacillus gellani]TQS75174.1 8-oxo-dGTP diphosphatase [Ornithinibacillus gellani]